MKYLLALTYILFIWLTACTLPTDKKLHEAERLIPIAIDSSLCILEGMKEDYPEMNNEEKALFGLLYLKALNKKGIDSDSDSPELIDFSISHYIENNNNQNLIYCYFYKAREHVEKREYAKATKRVLESLSLSNAKTDKTLMGQNYFTLARISGYQDDVDKALEYYQQASIYFEKAEETEKLSKIYLVMGWVYLAKEEFDTAIEFSEKTLRYTTDSIVMGDVLCSIGNSYYYKGQPDSAISYIRKSLHYPHYQTNESSRYYHLGNVYAHLHKYDSAKFYVNHALQLPIDIYFEEECYRVLTAVAIAEDDKKNLPIVIAKRQACQDSINRLSSQPNIGILEQLHHSDTEKDNVRYHRKLLIISFFILIVLGGIIFRLLCKRNRRKDEEAQTYKTELKKKQELLFQDVVDELEHTRTQYADMRKKANFEEREQLEKEVYTKVLRLDDEKAFIDKMNNALDNLPDKLKSDYPELNQKEIVWCCLFILQIPTSHISLILDYKQSSLYKFKQRLIKKLNFASAKEFEQMLLDK